jgi:enamine deaminase RidA (YjgF/YER057c/UK114 family)
MTPRSLGDEAASAYSKVGRDLAAVGLGWGDVARVTELLPLGRRHDHAEVETARRDTLGSNRPAVVTVVVEPLGSDYVEFGLEVDVVGADRPGPGVPAARCAPDGAVYLPTVMPVGEDGEVVHVGDFRSQYSWCLERAAMILADLGLGPEHLVQTIDYTTPATRDSYGRCGRPRREVLGPVYPGAAGILVGALAHPEVTVAFELTASRYRPTAINPGWDRYETLTYNPAVLAGPGLYGSGFAALDPVSQRAIHDGDASAQATFTYTSIVAVLAAVGARPEDLTGVREYVTPAGAGATAAITAARAAVLGASVPTTTVGCGTLLRPEFLLEAVPTAIVTAPIVTAPIVTAPIVPAS